VTTDIFWGFAPLGLYQQHLNKRRIFFLGNKYSVTSISTSTKYNKSDYYYYYYYFYYHHRRRHHHHYHHHVKKLISSYCILCL